MNEADETLEGSLQGEGDQNPIEYRLIASIMALGIATAMWLMREQIIALFDVFRAVPRLTL